MQNAECKEIQLSLGRPLNIKELKAVKGGGTDAPPPPPLIVTDDLADL